MSKAGVSRSATPIAPRLVVRRHVDFARVSSALCI
jgi:hypothetical protein